MQWHSNTLLPAPNEKAINNALAENDSKINQAAESLGISRKNLWEKMKRYNIDK